jgi:hypothetical protein
VDELLAELGCSAQQSSGGRSYRGPCPVHGGDGDSFQLSVGGHSVPVWWTCYSNQCEKDYKPSLLGLVRGVLSHRAGQKVPMKQALDYLKAFAGRKAGAEKLPARHTKTSAQAAPAAALSLSRAQVRSRLTPSDFFAGRGFSRGVLERFDVGHSRKLGKSVVPIYDDGGQTCVGFLSRSEKPFCEKCRRCHFLDTVCRYGQSKWAMSRGCSKSQLLYNYAQARQSSSRFVLLVEGPGDVWRAHEAGFTAVAPFGVELSQTQAEKLAALDRHIIIAFDNDEAGVFSRSRASATLRAQGVTVSVLPPPPAYKDVGEMAAEAVANWLREWEGAHLPQQ